MGCSSTPHSNEAPLEVCTLPLSRNIFRPPWNGRHDHLFVCFLVMAERGGEGTKRAPTIISIFECRWTPNGPDVLADEWRDSAPHPLHSPLLSIPFQGRQWHSCKCKQKLRRTLALDAHFSGNKTRELLLLLLLLLLYLKDNNPIPIPEENVTLSSCLSVEFNYHWNESLVSERWSQLSAILISVSHYRKSSNRSHASNTRGIKSFVLLKAGLVLEVSRKFLW